jgi:hypothetical protein
MNKYCTTERSLPGRHDILPDQAFVAGRLPELRRIAAIVSDRRHCPEDGNQRY